jgi:hypothetical protein
VSPHYLCPHFCSLLLCIWICNSFISLYWLIDFTFRFTTIFNLCNHLYFICHFLSRLILGDGSDNCPFIISMSTKALLSVLTTASSCQLPSVFHMDSMFKCNENEFPVTLLGISDAWRQFHLLSISVVSHCTQGVYRRLITSLQELVGKVMPVVSFSFQYCMTDCEAAER